MCAGNNNQRLACGKITSSRFKGKRRKFIFRIGTGSQWENLRNLDYNYIVCYWDKLGEFENQRMDTTGLEALLLEGKRENRLSQSVSSVRYAVNQLTVWLTTLPIRKWNLTTLFLIGQDFSTARVVVAEDSSESPKYLKCWFLLHDINWVGYFSISRT